MLVGRGERRRGGEDGGDRGCCAACWIAPVQPRTTGEYVFARAVGVRICVVAIAPGESGAMTMLLRRGVSQCPCAALPPYSKPAMELVYADGDDRLTLDREYSLSLLTELARVLIAVIDVLAGSTLSCRLTLRLLAALLTRLPLVTLAVLK